MKPIIRSVTIGDTSLINSGLVVVANNTNFCDHLSSYTGANWIVRSITRHKAGSAGYNNVRPVFCNTVGGITTEIIMAHSFKVEAWMWTESTSPVKLTFGGAAYCEFTGGTSAQFRADAPALTVLPNENIYIKTLAYASDGGVAGNYTWYGNIRTTKYQDSFGATASAMLADETPGAAGSPYGGKLSVATYDSPTTGVASISVTNQGTGYNATSLFSLWWGVNGQANPGAKFKGVGPSGGYVNVSSNKLLNVYVGTSKGRGFNSAKMPTAYAGSADYWAFGPNIIIGNPLTPSYSPIIFGDSWTAGSISDPVGWSCIYEVMMGQPSARVATNGNSLKGYLNNQTNIRARVAEWGSWGLKFSHVLCAHGVNDFRLWAFAADYGPNFKSDLASFKTHIQTNFGSAFSYGVITVPPSTTSTDGWTSTANQTPYVYSVADQYRANGPVINFNSDVRSGVVPRDFYLDIALIISDPSARHLFRTDCFDTTGSAEFMASDTVSTATDSVTFGTGTKTFTVGTNKYFGTQHYVEITDTGSGNKMRGSVTSYDNTTGVLTANVVYNGGGSATSTTWSIKVATRITTDGIHLGSSGLQWVIDNAISPL